MEEIGARCGCHSRTISNNLKKLDLYKYFHTKRNNHHVLNKPKTNHKCCICNISQADGNDVRKFKGKYYCKKHYNHMYRHGKIIKQTIYDKNDIIKHSNYAEIVLKNINMDIVGKSIIDLEDIEKVKKYKWYLTNDNYCVTKGINKKNVYIHDLIMDNLDFKFKYDHQDKNKLNNRKSNLRKANFQQNAVNSHVRSTNNTGVTGVQYHKIKNGFNWVSSLTYMYKPIYLGTYDLFDEAVKARLKGELEYFKEFSPNYNPHTNTLQITYLSHDDNKQTYIEMNMKGSILKLKKI